MRAAIYARVSTFDQEPEKGMPLNTRTSALKLAGWKADLDLHELDPEELPKQC